MTPYCGWSSWNHTTPAITSDRTYGTKMMVRSSTLAAHLAVEQERDRQADGELDEDATGRR